MTVTRLLAELDSAELTKWMGWYQAQERREAMREAARKGTNPRLIAEPGPGGTWNARR